MVFRLFIPYCETQSPVKATPEFVFLALRSDDHDLISIWKTILDFELWLIFGRIPFS